MKPSHPPAVSDEQLLVRDMLQTKLLAAVFMKSVRHEFILKGGMAMRTHKGPLRFTKDIDFESPLSASPERLRAAMRAAIKSALASHLIADAVVTEPKQTDTVLRWKINGKSPEGGSAIQLTVEVSRRGNIPDGHVESVIYTPPAEYGVGPVYVDRYDATAMAESKVRALTSPNRVAARDVYDLALIVETQMTPPIELLANRGEEAIRQAQQELWAKIEMLDWKHFQDEVLPYLDPATQSRITQDDYEAMRLRVGNAVEGWLNQAAEIARSRAKP